MNEKTMNVVSDMHTYMNGERRNRRKKKELFFTAYSLLSYVHNVLTEQENLNLD